VGESGTLSEHSVTVVEISLSALQAADRADEVCRWLTGTGIVVPAPKHDGESWTSAYRAGARVHDAAPGWPGGCPDGPRRGVDILVERTLYRAVDESAHPCCPGCGTPLDEQTQEDLIRPWLGEVEPRVTCPGCAEPCLLGDWRGGFQVGELAVRFNNWPELSDEFLARLGALLGPRWRVVHERF
jgi:hypothetical protein